MKFFKHFVDADQGSLNDLMNNLGVEAYGRYWLLTALCVSTLEKAKDETYSEADMKFTFNSRQLRNKLRSKSLGLEIFLTSCRDLSLFDWDLNGDKYTFYFPNILKSMDRDSKRARPVRAEAAPKNKRKRKRKINKEEKEKEGFESSLAEFMKLSGVTKGPKAEVRYAEQIKTPEDFLNLNLAITHYSQYLAENQWRKPKGTFETFLGTKASGYFWHDWVKAPSNVVAISGMVDLSEIFQENA